jgi:hypothetical protein
MAFKGNICPTARSTYHVSHLQQYNHLLLLHHLQLFIYYFSLHLPLLTSNPKLESKKPSVMLLSGLLSFLVFLLSFCLVSDGHESLGAGLPITTGIPVG